MDWNATRHVQDGPRLLFAWALQSWTLQSADCHDLAPPHSQDTAGTESLSTGTRQHQDSFNASNQITNYTHCVQGRAPCASLHFAHAETIIPMAGMLGLFGSAAPCSLVHGALALHPVCPALVSLLSVQSLLPRHLFVSEQMSQLHAYRPRLCQP